MKKTKTIIRVERNGYEKSSEKGSEGRKCGSLNVHRMWGDLVVIIGPYMVAAHHLESLIVAVRLIPHL